MNAEYDEWGENRNLPSQFKEYIESLNNMKTIEQIKDCQAIDLGYNSFRDLVLNPKQDMKMNHLNLCIERSMKEYADQEVQLESQRLVKHYEKQFDDFMSNR